MITMAPSLMDALSGPWPRPVKALHTDRVSHVGISSCIVDFLCTCNECKNAQ